MGMHKSFCLYLHLHNRHHHKCANKDLFMHAKVSNGDFVLIYQIHERSMSFQTISKIYLGSKKQY